MADSKKKKGIRFGKINKNINSSNTTFNDLVQSIDSDISGSSNGRETTIKNMADEINGLVFNELGKLTVDTGSEKFNSFIKTTYNKAGIELPNNINIEELFKADN